MCLGMSEDIRCVCRKFNIRVVFKSEWTLCSVLTKVKDTLPLSNPMWYIVSPAAVARSTSGRPCQNACERGMMEKSAVAEHVCENHHPIDWEEMTVLDHSRGEELLVKEGLLIQMTPSEEHFNRDGGLELPDLLDCCDEEVGREEQSSPTFDLQ